MSVTEKELVEYYCKYKELVLLHQKIFNGKAPRTSEKFTEALCAELFGLTPAVNVKREYDLINPKNNEKIEVRVIDLNEYLSRCVEIQVASATKEMSKKTWQEFYTKSMKKYLSLIEKGHGKWFGAFINDVLVGSLGIFKSGDTARFQLVNTHPDFQRQGVCSTLMYESCLYAMGKMNASELVIVAEENYHAVKIYQSVGFKEVQKQPGLCWWDKTKTNEA